MKKRHGFVSNSSSSSFLIPKSLLTAEQIELIKNHIQSGFDQEFVDSKSDEWTIEETESNLNGKTWMTNFNMQGYFEKIGIKNAKHYFDDEWEEDI